MFGRCRLTWLTGRVGALIALSITTSLTMAGPPRLARVTPPGGQRGTTVEIELLGRGLTNPRDLLFYESGIKVESITPVESMTAPNGRSIPVDGGTRVRVKLKLSDDCPLGPHGFRLRTEGGLSEYVRFFVGPFPTVEENELPTKRNDKRDSAQVISPNVTVQGRLLEAADVDVYKIALKKGQRLSAEVEAARLGVDRGIPDLFLTLTDADGKILASADDSALFVQDPVLSVIVDKDAAYFVEVRHSIYNATNDQYRLHVGTFSRPTGLYPSGGPAGMVVPVQVLGDPQGRWSTTVKLPGELGDYPATVVDPETGATPPSPNRFRVSLYPNVLEAEPNDTGNDPGSTASLPVAFNGIIGKPGDVDCFRFQAKKGEKLIFRTFANAIGSPVDPVIWIRAVNGKSVAQRATDSRPNQLGYAPANGLNRENHDPVLEFTVPADGEYILGVEDEQGAGGPDHVYRVEVEPEINGIHTYIVPEPENQNLPQVRQAISVAPGNRTTVQVGIFNTFRSYPGELELVGVDLPAGVTIKAPRFTATTTRVPVVFEATADAKSTGALVDLIVKPVDGSTAPFRSGYRQSIMMNAYGNNDYYLHVPVSRLALAVTEPAPFTIEVDEPKSALVQNGEMLLPVRIKRNPGFEGTVSVQMEWKPTGISTTTPLTLTSTQASGTYLLGATRNAPSGKYLVTLTATSGFGRRGNPDAEGRTYVASAPITLTIAEPHVEARIGRTSVERGKTSTITCKLNHLQPFEGSAKATLGRLPRGVELVETEKLIRAGDKEVTFTIKATPEALVGNYQGIVLDLTVSDHGQQIRQLSGYGLLRIDAERGVPAKK